MKRITLFLATITSVFMLAAVPAGIANAVDTETKKALCEGANLGGGNDDCNTGDPKGSIDGIIETVINVLSFVVGIVSVIMIIIGGFKYIISSGDSGNVTSAKNTILYAIIGLVVVALAQIIVRFVLTTV